jgi:hypothetical protein
MKVLVFSPYGLNTPHVETDLEITQGHVEAGDDVTVLRCEASLPACDVSPEFGLSQCLKCVSRWRSGGSRLARGWKRRLLPVRPANSAALLSEVPDRFSDLRHLIECSPGGLDAGWAAASSLVSALRDSDPPVEQLNGLGRRFLVANLHVYLGALEVLEPGRFDAAYVYNGRFAVARGFLRACQRAGVPCHLHERGADLSKYSLFANHLPQDIAYREAEVRRAWARAASPERETIGAKFFEERAAGTIQNWHSFVREQECGRLPEGLPASGRVVSLFLSSEDECMAIGDQWANRLYESQKAGVERILADGLNRDFTLVIRFHPNAALARGGGNWLRGRTLPSGVILVGPESPVSTYALLKASSAVLTFGSTVGCEATYWGKPSILLGRSFYEGLGVSFNPASHDEVRCLMRTATEPLPTVGALMYGHFLKTFGITFRYFEPTGISTGTFLGRKLMPSPAVLSILRMARSAPVRKISSVVSKRRRAALERVAPPA